MACIRWIAGDRMDGLRNPEPGVRGGILAWTGEPGDVQERVVLPTIGGVDAGFAHDDRDGPPVVIDWSGIEQYAAHGCSLPATGTGAAAMDAFRGRGGPR